MCGIAGAIVYDASQARLDCLLSAVNASETRGEDSFGVIRWSQGMGFNRFAALKRNGVNWLEEVGKPSTVEATMYLHTSRAEPTTEWRQQKYDADIPPFLGEGFAVAHNGIIANDHSLAMEYGLKRSSTIDTAIVPPLAARLGVWPAIASIVGGAALAILDSRRGVLVLCRNFMPLVIVWEPGIVCFASEAAFFPGFDHPFKTYQHWDVPPYTGIELSSRGYRGPIPWGAIPGWGEGDAWQPFPTLSWSLYG